jgi:UDP-N-acetylglucosamine--N-acetylmuramyl-(pentapeptide) pyrophosphoryl-undecaprenol N-acetylglucosamine transferase
VINLRVIISAGGTGGHIYPAVAIINKIKEMEPDSEFLYIGTHNRMEKDIIPAKGIPFESIEMYGFNRKHLLKNIKTINCLLKSTKKCKKLISDFKPDVVIGVGGYVTAPVIKSAKQLGYKTVIHEQNSMPGKANLMLSKYSDLIFVSFESTKNKFKNANVIFSGNPCSEDAVKVAEIDKKELGLNPNKKLILYVMGSLGAETVNNKLFENIQKFKNEEYEILIITGKAHYDKYKNIKLPNNVKVINFYENLTKVMKVSDIIISRAGASTLSEIIALDLPSILIPSPYVPDNHQYKNAMDLVNKDAALLLEEKDFNVDTLKEMIGFVLNNKNEENKIKNNLKTFDVSKSALIIYSEIKKLVKH